MEYAKYNIGFGEGVTKRHIIRKKIKILKMHKLITI